MLRIVPDGCESRTVLGAMLVLVLAAWRGRPPKPARSRRRTRSSRHPTILQEGMAAFRANCAYCHGMDGTRRARPRPDRNLRLRPHRRVALSARAGRRPRHGDAAGRRLPAGAGYLEGADVCPDAERAAACQAAAGDAANGERIFGRAARAVTGSTAAAACSVPTCRGSASRGRPPRSRAKSAAPSKTSVRATSRSR